MASHKKAKASVDLYSPAHRTVAGGQVPFDKLERIYPLAQINGACEIQAGSQLRRCSRCKVLHRNSYHAASARKRGMRHLDTVCTAGEGYCAHSRQPLGLLGFLKKAHFLMNTQAIRTSFLDTLPSGTKGPVTKGRHRRNALVYGLLCVAAFLPTLLHWSPGLQTLGLGLFAPGTGFLALGGWMALLFPLALGLFWLSIVAWFWTGMVVRLSRYGLDRLYWPQGRWSANKSGRLPFSSPRRGRRSLLGFSISRNETPRERSRDVCVSPNLFCRVSGRGPRESLE